MAKMLKFHHVGLVVPKEKYQQALVFYRDFLGFKEMYGGYDRDTNFMNLEFHDSVIELEDLAETLPPLNKDANGVFEHIAIDVDDLDEFIKDSEKVGCKLYYEPVIGSFKNGKTAKVCYITGPCKEAIELFQWLT